MPRYSTMEQRTGPRYLASLLVRAEWDDPDEGHIVAEGTTENVGPEGALIHLQDRLPDVGSRVQLAVFGEEEGEEQKLRVVTEVLRLERNPGHPLAALQLLDAQDEWRGLVWEPAAPVITQRASEEDDEDLETDEEEEPTVH
ncbi:MAG: PilZ domain-containing protein [Acidobacteria bacterium]|nr:PilZ domain-containing protein [Acidobacteriota bacterium]